MNNRFYIPLIAVRERQEYVDELKTLTRIDEVFYDDEHKGPMKNTLKALHSPKCKDVDYIMMLQDDGIPCDNMLEISDIIVSTHPDKVIVMHAFDFIDKSVEPYRDSDSPYYDIKYISGLGVILQRKYLEDYINIAMAYRCYYEDITMRAYCDSRNIMTITTIPDLIQHRGGKSILCPNLQNDKRISRYFVKNPIADWENKNINILKWHTEAEKYNYLNKNK